MTQPSTSDPNPTNVEGIGPESPTTTRECASATSSGFRCLPGSAASRVPSDPESKPESGDRCVSPAPSSFDHVGSMGVMVGYTVLIALGGLIFGYDIGTVGAILTMPSFGAKFGDDLSTTPYSFFSTTSGVLMGVASLGGCVGGLSTTKIIPKLGLKYTLAVATIFYFLGDLVILISEWWVHVLFGRVFIGIAAGLITIGCPILIGELSPVRLRGTLISVNQLITTMGILLGGLTVFGADLVFDGDNEVLKYEYPLVQGVGLSMTSFIAAVCVPESPVWCLMHRDSNEAGKAFARMRGISETHPAVAEYVEWTLGEMERKNTHEEQSKSLVTGQPRYLLRALTGVTLSCMQQLTGINYFFFFGVSIFRSVGVSNPYVVGVFFGGVNLIFSILGVPIVSFCRRTILLLVGSLLLALFMLAFATLGTAWSATATGAIGMIVASCWFIGVFAVSWGPLVSIIISELYPPAIKVKAVAICGCCGWLTTFMVSFLVPVLTKGLGFGLGYVFFGFILASGMFVYRFVPETRHVSARELDGIYARGEYRMGRRSKSSEK